MTKAEEQRQPERPPEAPALGGEQTPQKCPITPGTYYKALSNGLWSSV